MEQTDAIPSRRRAFPSRANSDQVRVPLVLGTRFSQLPALGQPWVEAEKEKEKAAKEEKPKEKAPLISHGSDLPFI